MPITALTHVVGEDRAHCARCGRVIPLPVGIYHFNRENQPLRMDGYKLPVGKKIAVITFSFNSRVSESSYLTGEHDSNSECVSG